MRIFEYSEITEGIPSDIVDTMLEIEGIRAFDGIRSVVYSRELASAILPVSESNARHSDLLETAVPDRAVAEGCMAMYSELSGENSLSVDEASLLHIHRTITNGTTKRDSRFRLRDYADDGTEPRHVRTIKPIPADAVKTSMSQMLSSYRMADEVGVNPLLLAPCMVLDLLNIHPFQEANWRISRAVLQMLLVDGGFGALRYIPLNERIYDASEDYYDSVSESSEGWRNNESDPFPFIRFVAEAVLGCYREFEARYPLRLGAKMSKAERIPSILAYAGHPLTKTEICVMLPDVSRRTMDTVLTELVRNGSVEKIGSYRDAAYRI